MSTRLAFYQLLFILVIGIEVAALHDAYREQPITIPATVAQNEQRVRWVVSDYSLSTAEKAVIQAPRRHQ